MHLYVPPTLDKPVPGNWKLTSTPSPCHPRQVPRPLVTPVPRPLVTPLRPPAMGIEAAAGGLTFWAEHAIITSRTHWMPTSDTNNRAPVVKGISRRPPEPEVGVRIPAGAPPRKKITAPVRVYTPRKGLFLYLHFYRGYHSGRSNTFYQHHKAAKGQLSKRGQTADGFLRRS